MAYYGWNLLGGFRLLEGSLGDLLGGVMGSNDGDAFGMVLETRYS